MRKPTIQSFEDRCAPSALLTLFLQAPEQVEVGEEFDLLLYARDNREDPPARGAFSAYADVTIVSGGSFIGAQVGDFDTLPAGGIANPQMVEEFGGIDLSLQQPGEEAQLLGTFTVEAPDVPGTGLATVSLSGPPEILPSTLLGEDVLSEDLVERVGVYWEVVGNYWHNPDDPCDVNRSGEVDVLDAFAWLDAVIERGGVGPLEEVDQQQLALDVNDDEFVTALDLLLTVQCLFEQEGEYPHFEEPEVPVEPEAPEGDNPEE